MRVFETYPISDEQRILAYEQEQGQYEYEPQRLVRGQWQAYTSFGRPKRYSSYPNGSLWAHNRARAYLRRRH